MEAVAEAGTLPTTIGSGAPSTPPLAPAPTTPIDSSSSTALPGTGDTTMPSATSDS